MQWRRVASVCVPVTVGINTKPNATKESVMWKFLVPLLVLSANAWSQQVKLGEAVNASVSMCETQADAEAVVKTHQSKGIAQASLIFGEKCFSGVVNVVPEQVLGRYQTDQGTMKVIRVAVLMKDNTRKPYFILTTNAIFGET